MTVPPGIRLLIGENGAGKTTLLHLLATLLLPSSGSVEIDGVDSRLRLPSTLRKIYFLPDNPRPEADTIEAMVRLHARPFYPDFCPEMLDENLRDFGVASRQPLSTMSLGQRKKALMAYALALRPEIILLDEPANGFDIGSRDTLRRMMARCVEPEQTVIVSTHTTADLLPLFDGIIMLGRGRLLFSISTEELMQRLTFTVDTIPPLNAIFTLNDIGRFRSITPPDPSTDPGEIDIHLLYTALHSPAAPEILKIINTI